MLEKTTDSGSTRQRIGSKFVGNLIAVFRGLVFEDDAQQHRSQERVPITISRIAAQGQGLAA